MNDAALGALAREFAKLVAVELAALLTAPASHYGSSKTATQPPGKSRDWTRRNLKTIPGARKVGRDWVISVEDFEVWATQEDADRAKTPVLKDGPVASLSLAQRAERALTAAGFRPTR